MAISFEVSRVDADTKPLGPVSLAGQLEQRAPQVRQPAAAPERLPRERVEVLVPVEEAQAGEVQEQVGHGDGARP